MNFDQETTYFLSLRCMAVEPVKHRLWMRFKFSISIKFIQDVHDKEFFSISSYAHLASSCIPQERGSLPILCKSVRCFR